jgi:hypothetical protein
MQVYLRRYLCNYRNTSQIKEDKFAALYEKELEKLIAGRNQDF